MIEATSQKQRLSEKQKKNKSWITSQKELPPEQVDE